MHASHTCVYVCLCARVCPCVRVTLLSEQAAEAEKEAKKQQQKLILGKVKVFFFFVSLSVLSSLPCPPSFPPSLFSPPSLPSLPLLPSSPPLSVCVKFIRDDLAFVFGK